MNISIILAHPYSGSLNYAIARTAKAVLTEKGYDVRFHDLYEEEFDPILPLTEIQMDSNLNPDLEKHVMEIEEADGIVIVHPIWWGMPPAVLTGWVDRVMRPGRAYEFPDEDGGEGEPIGLLKARAAVVFNTSNTLPDRERDIFGDPMERIWKDCIFDLCGVEKTIRKCYSVVVISSEDERKQWLDEVREIVDQAF